MIDRMRKQANGQHARREEDEGEGEREEKVPFALSLFACSYLLSFAFTRRVPSRSPAQLYTVFSPVLLLLE